MKKEFGQFSYIKNMLAEQKAYRKAKRIALLREVANWSSCVVLGILVAILLWLAINY